jgi:hypothetical protein
MNTQDDGYSRRERLGRRVLAGIAAILIGASFIFTSSASAHNINLNKAWEMAREYARGVRAESNGKYLHYTTDCWELFEGHNHYVRCGISYNNRVGDRAPTILCRETIDVYHQAHGDVVRFVR